MGVYLYCVLPADAPDPAVAGLDGARLRALRAEDVCVWIGDVDAAPHADLRRIRDHDRVIRSATEAGLSPVPIRFGQVLADDEALRRHLRERDYRPLLERLAGVVEFGIRIADPAPADRESSGSEPSDAGAASAGEVDGGGAGSGAAYLHAVAARLHAAESGRARALEAAHDLDRALAAWVRDSRIESAERPPGAAVAHLVQTDAADEYRARARELAAAHSPLHVIVTGPWPPYSFVDA